MRQLKIILLLVAFSCSVFAQDRLSLFISRANKYASVELSDYRKRLCVEYNMSNNSLDDYYRRCGRNWGNVGLALEIARTSGRHMRDVCEHYCSYCDHHDKHHYKHHKKHKHHKHHKHHKWHDGYDDDDWDDDDD